MLEDGKAKDVIVDFNKKNIPHPLQLPCIHCCITLVVAMVVKFK